MPIANSTNRYTNSRYIVDNVTPGFPFTTIQAAINAAVADGGNAEIWVRQGTYTENLTLYDGVNIEGAEQTLSILIGTHTPPTSGQCRFTRMGLRSATHILSSAAAGSTTLSCLRCQFQLTNGYVYNLPNWTGELRMRWCTDYSTNNGLVNNAGGSVVTFNHSLIGKGSGQTFTANGNCLIFSVLVGCPMLFNGTGSSVIEAGSVVEDNIATANTHTLILAQIRITTGINQAITHNSANTLVLDEVIVKTTNATAIGGSGTLKMMSTQFPNTNAIAGTLTVSLEGVTRTAEMWAENIIRMRDTGFYSWAAAGPYFDDTTLGTFKLLVGGTGYIKDQRITWAAQNYVGMTTGNTYYIYVDNTGTIGATTTRTDALFEDNIVLFECLRDSTLVNNQITVQENHPYSFQVAGSNFLHNTAGIVIQNANNGANITLNGTQKIQINTADVLNDHGLTTTIPDSGGVGVTWRKMYTTAGGKWATYTTTDTFSGIYNNAGTPTALGANKYGIYRLYVTKQNLNTTTPLYIAVLDTAQYNNLGQAQAVVNAGTAASATNELDQLELAQLGFIIFAQSSTSIVQVTVSKSTLRSSTSTGTSSSGFIWTEVAADTAMVANNGYIANKAATECVLTLPTTSVVGIEIGACGKGATGWRIAQGAGQQIIMGNVATTAGAGGYIEFTNQYDAVRLLCTVANTTWTRLSSSGNITVV